MGHDDGGRLRVGLFGRLRLWSADREVAVRPGQQRAIVALLALAGGQPVPRRAIVGSLWSRDAPPTAWNIVQTHIKRLRAALEPGRAAWGDSAVFPRAGDGYRLAVRPDDVDLLRWARLIRRARDARRAGRDHEAFALLGAALDLWRSDPLADVPLLAEHPEVAAAERRRWVAVGAYTEAGLDLARAADVLAPAELAASANPLDEQTQARLIRVYLQLGRRDDAFAVYHDTRRRLVDGLGVEPGAELRDAYRRGLVAGPARRDPTTATAPAQLPADIADFTGRRGEVDRITRLLDGQPPASPTVVALVGMGGIGKTTLAVHTGHALADRYPDGQLYATLRGAGPAPAAPAEVLGGLLLALGVPGSALPDGVDDRAALFRGRVAGRRVLLVLDDAADEAQVRPLLPGSPTCAVLVTSRQRLGALHGAHALTLGELDPADGSMLLRRLVGADRIAVDPVAAADIVAICAGVPLAIRVTGARLAAHPHRPLPWLAHRLRDRHRRLDELTAGDLAVRGSLALSYAAVPVPARRALRLASLLDAHDITDWAIAALLGCPQRRAEAIIDTLLDAHLLAHQDTDATGTPRYRLHDLVRLYARERAHTLDPPAVRTEAVDRAFGAWLSVAETADERLACRYLTRRPGPAGRVTPDPEIVERLTTTPTAWFEAERANLAAVIAQAAGSGRAAYAWNLADAAIGFYEMRDLRDDWAATHRAALASCAAAGDTLGGAVMARNLAYRASAAIACDVAGMRTYAELAHRRFVDCADTCGQAESLVLLGELDRMAGAGDPAAARFHDALTLARAGGHTLAESVAHNEIAWLARDRGDLASAVRSLHRSLRRCAAHGNARPRYNALRLLGLIEVRRDRRPEAESHLREALTLAQAMRSPVKQAQVLREIGGLQLAGGHHDQAAATLAEAHDLSLAAADPVEQAYIERWQGRLALAEGRPHQAKAALTTALAKFTATATSTYVVAMTLRDLGKALAACDDPRGASARWRAARRLYVKLSNEAAVADIDALSATSRT